jgi:hypothetical protein
MAEITRVSETMCKEGSVSLPLLGDSHDDQFSGRFDIIVPRWAQNTGETKI